jgi:hypothetical protein
MKHASILFLSLVALLASCTKTETDTFSHESAQQAAKRYYTHFTQGDAKQFVEGMVNAESFSEDYRMQMQDVIAHAAKELTKRGGVVRIVALSDSLYAADSTAYVFLDLVFADSIHEQVGLPMVFRQSKWRMK